MNQLTTARHGTACSTSKLTGNSIASSVNKEFIFVSDERGIQGRLEERAGTALGAVFVAQPRDLKLDAFKSVLPPYPGHKKAPDFMLITVAHKAKVVGEAKFPWIPEHYQRDLVREFEAGIIEEPFRHALGQIAQYIIELGPKYGFLTTYDQTIFLREADVT
ncbi:hypothetical protein N7457_007724 [Penicillium paradoxum]|uniref:uncharacterized protein n=1 Tax=Penicillium paradoxum TaxID=176176 RepID=UPI002547235B|nr:uncharacterized protein N7457_007724 [Penicillium paradoxum]KAJ5772828.1 hypothetical protein N7457_007724 [Penicillium paradoxum]